MSIEDTLALCISDPGSFVPRNRAGGFLNGAESVPRWGARAILASGVLDQIKADAWDEGKESGHDANCRLNAEPYSCICVNPYRKEGATT